MKRNKIIRLPGAIFLLFMWHSSISQSRRVTTDDNVTDTSRNPAYRSQNNTKKASKDSGLKHRNDLEDSITISYKYLDSLKSDRLDSSINDFNHYFSVPADYVTIGNNGSAAFPVLFTPVLHAGWDAGFHAFDVYRLSLEQTRFYKTTRPYTQISYLLASGKEQFIDIIHTQNIQPNWNFGFNYRLINAPGFFKSQNTNHNSYRFFTNYQGKKKRYAAFLILQGNKITTSENGGIQNDSFLTNQYYNKRFTIPVNLGGDAAFGQNIFSTTIYTGNLYKDFTLLLRQSYDFGKKDSIIINDSTKEFLFYPKFRFQHTLTYNTYSYHFKDTLSSYTDALSDSTVIQQWYDTSLSLANGFNFNVIDQWKSVTNDFSIRQFPQTKNPAQYIEAGLRLENFKGTFTSETLAFYNLVAHGEYRNKTKNKKWDADINGEFYATGYYAGDYDAAISLTRFLNKKLGDVHVEFENVNRTPSFIFSGPSSFNFKNDLQTKKENITLLEARADNPKFSLEFRNMSIANYSYFLNYYQPAQDASLINITQFIGYKKTKLSRHLNLYSDAIVQQTTGNAPIKVPLVYTRERLAFEGVFFKNLNLSTGLDVNYSTPYKENNYSPITGQFVPQDTVTIYNRPNVGAFFNFRIKSFTGLIKVENLNTIDFSNVVSFTKNNFAAPHYPTPGFIFRLGVSWRFVN